MSRLTKGELVELCRERKLKVSGTKAELLERLSVRNDDSEDMVAMMTPKREPRTEERQQSFYDTVRSDDDRADTEIDTFVSEMIKQRPEAVDAQALIAKTELLLTKHGEIYQRVKRRRLMTNGDDATVRATFAFLDGFVAAQQRSRARDAVRLVLRAATEGAIDEAFRRLREDGDLGPPLERYVDGLIHDRMALKGDTGITDDLFAPSFRPFTPPPPPPPAQEKNTTAVEDDDTDIAEDDLFSGDLLTKVLHIIKDRIQAEHHVAQSKELRTLAIAMQLRNPDERKAFLSRAMGETIDFAQRFEAYVNDARGFLDHNDDADSKLPPSQRDAIRNVADIVNQLRRAMPI